MLIVVWFIADWMVPKQSYLRVDRALAGRKRIFRLELPVHEIAQTEEGPALFDLGDYFWKVDSVSSSVSDRYPLQVFPE